MIDVVGMLDELREKAVHDEEVKQRLSLIHI